MAKPKDKLPWFKFYPSDWAGDRKLHMCSIAARGLWADLLCVMHEAEPYGHLVTDGHPVTLRQIAALAGITPTECGRLMAELESAGVYSRTENGTIFSRRMVRDKEKSGQAKRWGKDGGNPKLTGNDKGRVNPPDKARDKPQSPETRIDDAVDARERLIGPEALALTERLLVIAGHDLKFWPPGWCGAPMRVQTWLSQGWKAEIIVAAVTGAAARKRGAPANSIQFFENAVAEEVARQSAPLPSVEIRQPEHLTVTHGKPKSAIIQAADNLCRTIAGFDGPQRGADELRGAAGEAPPRLLSHG